MLSGRAYPSRGFTLIELLVVIAIIMIIASVGLSSTRPLSRHAKLLGDANEVVSLLRTTRQHAISVAAHPTKTPTTYPSYGVSIPQGASTITEYADCKPDDNGTNGTEFTDTFRLSNSCGAAASSDTIIETLILQGSTVTDISYIESDGTTFSLPLISILYLRPEPTIWFATAVPPAGAGLPATFRHPGSGTIKEPGTVVLTLTSLDGLEDLTIRFNSVGLAVIVQ